MYVHYFKFIYFISLLEYDNQANKIRYYINHRQHKRRVNLLCIILANALEAGESGISVKQDFPSSQHLPIKRKEQIK